jgi:ribonuclease Z
MNFKIFDLALLLLISAFLVTASVSGQEIKVTLLGTGCPDPAIDRFGPSILVEAGSHKFIFDAGRGAIQRLKQANVSFKDVDGVFFTHLHSDHVVGFPDLWLTGWVYGRREVPLRVWGPNGTKAMTRHLTEAFEFDLKIRVDDGNASPTGAVIEARDISEGVVYDQDGVKVTAFLVDHGPVKPAFGYRLDYLGRSVAISGDTRPSPNLVKYAKGVDLLIHEVAVPSLVKNSGRAEASIKAILGHHTTPEQAGEIFAQVKPKLAVYSHIVFPWATEQDVIPPTRKTYAGPLELGEDLMIIRVGETVSVERPKSTR